LMYKTWKLCCHCSTAAKGWPRKFYFWKIYGGLQPP